MRYPGLCILMLTAVLFLTYLEPLNAGGQLSVTVSTDRQTYGLEETVTITGNVSDGNLQGVPFASVSIQVVSPSGDPMHIASVITSADGTYTDQFTVPAGSTDGGYVIYVTASKPGYSDASSQTAYTVIPEFPISGSLWLMLLSILFVALFARRKQSNR